MKIFPHILSRVGGFPFREVEKFAMQDYIHVITLLRLDKKVLKHSLEIEMYFQEAIDNTADNYFQTILLNALKDFRKSRFSFLKKLEKFENVNLSITKIRDAVIKHQGILKIRNDWNKQVCESYENELTRSFQLLKDFAEKENFQKGIIQSSRSVYQRILSFNKKEITEFRKKEKQTARTLTQYIYRTVAKTSPFSHFTTIDLMSLKNGVFQSKKESESISYLQYNNFLLLELKEMFLKKMSFVENTILRLNPSIIQNELEYCFIKNDRNVEIFQRLEKSEFLELIYNKLNTQGEVFKFFIKNIQNDVDAAEEELREYLMNLVEAGFLEFQWNFYGGEKEWETEFSNWLIANDNFKETNPWEDLFNQLISKKKKYKRDDSKKRFYLQNRLKYEIEVCGFSETKPEIILFEDVWTPRGFTLQDEAVQPIVSTLDSLLFFVEPLMVDEMKLKIHYLHEKHFKDKPEVSLVEFYEIFFQEDFEKVDLQNDHNEYLKERWKEAITQTGKMSSEGTLHFSLDEIRKKIPPRKVPTYKYSGLFQFYKEDEKTKAVINGLSPGYGKLYGRFLHMFPEEITKDLQEWNKPVNEGYIIAENKDASYYNVNLHPPLVEYEIKMHHSQNQLSSQYQIPVSEMVIRRGDSGRDFYLYSSKTQKHIDITDLGFENPKARSPMFQLINGFRETHGTYRIFLKMVNEIYVQENEEGIRFYPRVVIDEHLILQRSAQVMDVSFFPKINKNDHAADFFYQIQKFKQLHNLPQYVFVQPIRDFSNPENILKQDFYKPQFIDLHAPISIEILKSIIQKHQGKIKIEEMLPMPNQLDSKYVREDVIEWKRY